ncbi:PDR/VanB family oxidoreductase [Massilia niabensis]|uniref:PDR/VanB family oxidoreductase n=1 Tax=Massilia niabensis TaxID=544910 RepID=A0ABW0L5Q1_9BURK
MNTIAVKVEKKTREAEDIVSLELASVDGKPLPPFSAGSHIDVHVGQGLVRQYSLCNDPIESHRYQIAILRDPHSRGGSAAVHEKISMGDVIQISEPRNHFPLANAEHYLLLAGGIGVTPILCMAERLATIGVPFDMHYCSRSPERTAFLERIRTSAFTDRVHFHFDTGDTAQKLDLDKVLAAAGNSTHLYVCGPAGFIEFVTDTARNQGWDADRVHLEYFGAAPQDTAGDIAFEVKIASSGMTYTIPTGKSVCTALLEHGIDIPVSCEQGVCGTCITRVLDGTIDHRDVYFTDEEKAANDQFTPCCSRAKSSLLVLDL